jgi:hypothetical protein
MKYLVQTGEHRPTPNDPEHIESAQRINRHHPPVWLDLLFIFRHVSHSFMLTS